MFGLLVHLIAVLVIYMGFRPVGGGADYELYDEVATKLYNRFWTGDFSLGGLFLGHGFSVIISILYILFYPSMILGQFFMLWFFVLSLLFVYMIALEISNSTKIAFWTGFIIIFYPSYLYFGSLLLKDPIIIPAILLALLLAIKMLKNFSWAKFAIFFAALTAVIQLRFYIGYALLLGFLISWFLASNFILGKRIKYGIILFILLGFSPLILGNGYYGFNDLRGFLNFNSITFFREIAYAPVPIKNPATAPDQTVPDQTVPDQTVPDQTAPDQTAPDQTAPAQTFISNSQIPGGKGSSFAIETGFDKGALYFLKNYSLSFTYAFLGPLPWQFRFRRHIVSLVETIPWYLLVVIFIFSFLKIVKTKGLLKTLKQYKFCSPLLFFSLMSIGALSLFINNYGIIARIRMPVYISLILIMIFIIAENEQEKIKKIYNYVRNYWHL
jgi:hypothetical protein